MIPSAPAGIRHCSRAWHTISARWASPLLPYSSRARAFERFARLTANAKKISRYRAFTPLAMRWPLPPHAFTGKARPLDDFKTTPRVFHERRAAFNPVAIVAVKNVADHLHFHMMDVPANDPVDPAVVRRARHGVLEIRNEDRRVLDFMLQVSGQGPVWKTKTAPDCIDERVQT